MAISGGDGSIILTTEVDTSGVNKGMTSIKSIVGKVGGVMAAAFSVRALVRFGKEAINLASDLQEVQNVVDVAFGNMAYKIEKFAETAIYNFGISKLSAKQWASTMMAMGSGMGQAMEIGSDMAVELTGRLADVMSFYNKTEQEAFTLGKAIYSGETEPLKNIGVIMTETNLELFAMQKGYAQTYKSMDAANKLLVRQQFFLEKTALAAGDYVKTQDGWANSTRTLQQRWKEMQTEFGQAFMAVGTLVLPAVNKIITGMTKLAQITSVAAQNIYRIFTGKTLEFGNENISNIADSSSEASDGMAELGDEATKTKKKIDKSLATFDELNILSSGIAQDLNKGADGIEGLGGAGSNVIESDNDNDYMSGAKKIDTALSYIMGIVGGALIAIGLLLLFNGHIGWGIGFIIAGSSTLGISMASLMGEDVTQNAANALSSLMGIISGAAIAIGVILCFLGSWAWGIGFIIVGAATLGVGIATIVKFGANDIEQTLMFIQGIAAGAMLALGIILLIFTGPTPISLGLLIGGALLLGITIAQIVAGEMEENVKKMIHTIVTIVSGALLALGIILLFTPMKGLALGLIIAGALGLATEVALNWDEFKEAMRGHVGDIVKIASTATLALGVILLFTPAKGLGIGLIILSVTTLVTSVAMDWEGFKEEMRGHLGEMVTMISTYALALGVTLLFVPAARGLGIALIIIGVSGLVTAVGFNWNDLTNIIRTALTTITNVISGFSLALGVIMLLSGNFPTGLALIALGVGGLLFTNSANKIDGSAVKDEISAELNEINNEAKKGVNEINNTLSNINFGGAGNFSNVFGKSSAISYSVPHLAKGAVIPPNKQFLAVLGDQKSGTNVEAPLSVIEQAVANVLGQQGSNGGNSTVVLQIDGRELGRAVVEQGNRENRRIGMSLLAT